MEKNKSENVKILFNSMISYLRILCTTVFSLLTVRYLIEALGIEQFGIYALITGVVTILAFLNSAMTVSTQRYLSYHQGTGNIQNLNKIFKSSLLLHTVIGLVLVVILFGTMHPLINNFLNINPNLIERTYYLYSGVTVSIFFTIITVPFNALLVSHENFRIDAFILVLKAFLLLIFSIAIHLISEEYRLISFSIILVGINIIVFLCYFVYCRSKYDECSINAVTDSHLLKEMTSFALWNLYTNLCYVLNTQGINIVINKFFGAKMNAAYGIAFQVNGQVKNLSQTLLSAMNPQIMKSEGRSNRERAIHVSVAASKIGFFLVALVTIPCLYILPNLIELWLGIIPQYVVLFTIFFLFANLINQLTVGVTPAVQAVGKIKKFQMVIGSTALIVLPISYILLHYEFSIYYVLYILIFIEIVTGIMKIWFFSEILSVKISWYIKNVIFRMIFPFLVTNLLLYGVIDYFILDGVVLIITLSLFSYITISYLFSLNRQEKKEVNSIFLIMAKKFNL
ncbi:lipopolysaccharide biosynthesis protein [Providencia rettgeri]|uniref:lipopolysaccharide biosynthesis protein n=1 Tax=Providencia rettgeri TaxID=587 RepID=UPI0023AAF1CB|nr:MATE family efflux transporter [Providencia rettgeri]